MVIDAPQIDAPPNCHWYFYQPALCRKWHICPSIPLISDTFAFIQFRGTHIIVLQERFYFGHRNGSSKTTRINKANKIRGQKVVFYVYFIYFFMLLPFSSLICATDISESFLTIHINWYINSSLLYSYFYQRILNVPMKATELVLM